jgi:hypothetical protein
LEKGLKEQKTLLSKPKTRTILDVVEAFALSFKDESKEEKIL